MKVIKILALLVLLIGATDLSAQNADNETSIKKMSFVISKLMINGKDLTDSLRIVNISKDIWLERNKEDREIGRGNIIKNKDNEIHVKWMSVSNGARKDAITIYKYKKIGEKYTFEIYYNDKKQGYFIGKSYE